MSSHSRSSSEVLTLQYNDILPVFFKAFRDNFDFDDVKDDVKHLFTKEEYQLIINEPDEIRRLVLLFEIFRCKESIIPEFLDIIKQDYSFLSEPIKYEREHPSKDTVTYIDKVHLLRSTHPKHTDFNVLRINEYIPLRNALRKLKRYHSVILQGDLGQGKKWLTINVCYDYAVMKSMDFQIYWLDVSDCTSPEQDLNRLQTLRLMLGDANGSSNGFAPIYQEHVHPTYNESILNRILELQHCIREKLKLPHYQNCLVILKDVQNFKTFQTFNLGCKLLIITRNRKVCESLTPKMSTHLTIACGLTLSEFYTLFEKYLNQTRDKFPKNAIDIYDYSNGHPYLLSIIAQNLRQKKSTWNEWIRNLQNQKIVNDKFLQVIDISLNVLPKEQLKLYATLGVFKSSVPIPIKLLAALWNKSLHDADHIVHRFNKFSFVSVVPCNSDDENAVSCCVVPFVYSSHLASERMKAMINAKELHAKIIEYYKIEQAFEKRTEIDLCTSHHDQYFFSYIGDHLHEAGRIELFPMIYLDFGFLEQKIRAVGLSNTIIDLKRFENEITNSDYRKDRLLSDIREFLPKIEEKLTESRDTSLLQYALMATGTVYEEATRQMCQFPHRVWFSERGNFHKRRQIVSLMNEAKCIRFLDQDMCLVVLTDGNMLLLDISLYCTKNPVFLKNDTPSKGSMIMEARLFRENKFILALDDNGALKVWSIADDHRRSVVYRRSSRQKVNSINFHSNQKMTSKRFKQKIHVNSMGQHGFIVAFFIEQLPPNRNNDTYLHIAFRDGDICIYKWNSETEEFTAEHTPILQTKATDIRFFTKILDKFYMILNKSGNITFWNLRDSSKGFVPFDWPKNTSGPLSYEQSTFKLRMTVCTRTIFVFTDKVVSLIFEHRDYNVQPDGQVEILYENRLNFKSAITCAKLSEDQRYLVLGTKRGLIVYDIDAKSEVLRSNVSDAIACVDIYPLVDKIFKYVIICGAEHRKALHIFAVRTNGENGITWAHNVTSMGNETSGDPQLEADVWLLGQKLYDIDYKCDGSILLVAVDSKYRVHQVNTTKTKSWSIINPRETSVPITSITTGQELAFVGYNNGDIFNISNDAFEKESLNEAIIYLQIIDDCHLIASSETQTCISNVGDSNNIMKIFDFSTKHCYKVRDEYILLVSETGLFTLIENKGDGYELKVQGSIRENYWDTITLRGCDFQADRLCLASTTFVKIFLFLFQENIPKVFLIINQSILNTTQNLKSNISCVALAKDASLVAMGYTNGDIEIYKLQVDRMDCFYNLQSHHSRIYDMKFSPNNEVLASCGEQLCFWNMLYIQNNPLKKNSPKRRSSRFSSQHSYETEEVDAKPVLLHDKYLCTQLHEQNGNLSTHSNLLINALNSLQFSNGNGSNIIMNTPWRDKQGPADKPELLSCIKFDGKKAEKLFANPDFTQFNTIDDEGVYYHLVLFDDDDDDENTPFDNETSSSLNGTQLNVVDMTTTRFSLNIDENSMGEDEVYV